MSRNTNSNASIENTISDGWEKVCDSTSQHISDCEAYIRQEPLKAVGYAIGVGYVLRMLPVGGIISLLAKVILMAIKPAVLLYGAGKAYELIQKESHETPQ